MLILLGLGTKPFRFPTVTLIIAALNVIIFFYTGHYRAKQETQINQAIQKSRVAKATGRLFIEYCVRNGGKIKFCKKTSKVAAKSFLILKRTAAHTIFHDLYRYFSNPTLTPLDGKYSDIIRKFQHQAQNQSSSLKALRGYKYYEFTLKRFHKILTSVHQKFDLYSPLNAGLRPLLFNQFRHFSWIHLMGNLLILLVLGTYVEQRLHGLVYLGLFLLGGSLAFTVHASSGPLAAPLLGASGAISSILGMFYVFYFTHSMRFSFLFIKYFTAPVKFCLPLTVITADVIATFTTSNITSYGTVAHSVHLTGFLSGIVFALVAVKLYRLPKVFISLQEGRYFSSLKKARRLDQALVFATKIIKSNPDNYLVIQYFIGYFFSSYKTKAPSKSESFPEAIAFCDRHFQTLCAILLRKKNPIPILKLLKSAPRWKSINSMLGRMGQQSTVKLARIAIKNRDSRIAMAILESHLIRFSGAKINLEIKDRLNRVIAIISDHRLEQWFVNNYFEESNYIGHYLKQQIMLNQSFQQEATNSPDFQQKKQLLRQIQSTLSANNFLGTTSEDFSIYPQAKFSDRGYALAADLFFVSTIASLVNLPITRLMQYFLPGTDSFVFAAGAALVVTYLFYYLMPLHRSGQTIGKKIFGLRLVTSSQQKNLGYFAVSQLILQPLRLLGTLSKWSKKGVLSTSSHNKARVIQYRYHANARRI